MHRTEGCAIQRIRFKSNRDLKKMNGEKIKTRILREISPEWEEIMRLSDQIKNGEIIIKKHQGKIALWEYHIKRKNGDRSLETIPLA